MLQNGRIACARLAILKVIVVARLPGVFHVYAILLSSNTRRRPASRRATGSLYTGEPRAHLSRTSDSVGSSSWRTRTPKKKKRCTRKPESRFPRKVTGNITHITCYFSHLQSYYLLLFTPIQATPCTPLIHSAIFHCSEA